MKRMLEVGVIGACSVLGLAAVGLTTPPDDHTGHAPKPAAKTPATKQPAPKPKAEPAPKPTPAHEPDAANQSPPTEQHDDHASKPRPEAPATVKQIPVTEDVARTPESAMQALREGNERWVNAQAQGPNADSGRREETARAGQKPFATILTCADSRIPVERVFDRGVGDVFVVRVAGNVMSPEVAGTIEYGAEHLNVPLLVVMGHTKCGAVAAAASGGEVEGNVGSLIERISPAVARARQQEPGAAENALVSASVKENVWQSIFDLVRTSPEARHLLQEGKLQIVGAVYDVGTGKVEWMGPHPWQDALVDAFNTKANANPHAPATADASDEH